jgi:hypothetical protein
LHALQHLFGGGGDVLVLRALAGIVEIALREVDDPGRTAGEAPLLLAEVVLERGDALRRLLLDELDDVREEPAAADGRELVRVPDQDESLHRGPADGAKECRRQGQLEHGRLVEDIRRVALLDAAARALEGHVVVEPAPLGQERVQRCDLHPALERLVLLHDLTDAIGGLARGGERDDRRAGAVSPLDRLDQRADHGCLAGAGLPRKHPDGADEDPLAGLDLLLNRDVVVLCSLAGQDTPRLAQEALPYPLRHRRAQRDVRSTHQEAELLLEESLILEGISQVQVAALAFVADLHGLADQLFVGGEEALVEGEALPLRKNG